MNYINISDKYGDAVEVTISDYQELNPDGNFVEDCDGIYEDGEQIAEVAEIENEAEIMPVVTDMQIIVSGLQAHPHSIKIFFDDEPEDDMPNATAYNIGGTVWVKNSLTINPDTPAFVEAITNAFAAWKTHQHSGFDWMSIETNAQNSIKAAVTEALQ